MSIGLGKRTCAKALIAYSRHMQSAANPGRPIVSLALAMLGLTFGAFALQFALISSPHYGWLLHRWALFFLLASSAASLGFYVGGRKTRWASFAVLIVLAVSAIDPLFRIIFYGSWWDI
ncbi:hypothetical protein [Sphingomonas fuzhouensis]|uniref:hypothetical protein n=1 Tax=Sphingomonas fuzhouensis TaxID=3106033 RepID=UPI002AFFF5E5|nr:hypothetical protein [Sphingomonas sp. SGZ-02]